MAVCNDAESQNVSWSQQADASSRIELATRILAEIQESAAADQLKKKIESSALKVAKYGAPVAQVRVLHALADDKRLDVSPIFEVLAESDDRWVVEQLIDRAPKLDSAGSKKYLALLLGRLFAENELLINLAAATKASFDKRPKPILFFLVCLLSLVTIIGGLFAFLVPPILIFVTGLHLDAALELVWFQLLDPVVDLSTFYPTMYEMNSIRDVYDVGAIEDGDRGFAQLFGLASLLLRFIIILAVLIFTSSILIGRPRSFPDWLFSAVFYGLLGLNALFIFILGWYLNANPQVIFFGDQHTEPTYILWVFALAGIIFTIFFLALKCIVLIVTGIALAIYARDISVIFIPLSRFHRWKGYQAVAVGIEREHVLCSELGVVGYLKKRLWTDRTNPELSYDVESVWARWKHRVELSMKIAGIVVCLILVFCAVIAAIFWLMPLLTAIIALLGAAFSWIGLNAPHFTLFPRWLDYVLFACCVISTICSGKLIYKHLIGRNNAKATLLQVTAALGYLVALPLTISYLAIFTIWLIPWLGEWFARLTVGAWDASLAVLSRAILSYFSIVAMPGIPSAFNYILTIISTLILVRSVLAIWSFYYKKMTFSKLIEDIFISLGILLSSYIILLIISLTFGAILSLSNFVLPSGASDGGILNSGVTIAISIAIAAATFTAVTLISRKKFRKEEELNAEQCKPDQATEFLNYSLREKKRKLQEVLCSAEAGENIDEHLEVLHNVAEKLPRVEPFWGLFCRTVFKIEKLAPLNRGQTPPP